MNISIAEHAIRIVIISLEGRLDVFSVPYLRERINTLMGEGVIKFVLDLTQISFLDSAGMAVLVTILKRTRELGGDVRLVWPQEEAARQILRLTKFDRAFTIMDCVEEAVRHF